MGRDQNRAGKPSSDPKFKYAKLGATGVRWGERLKKWKKVGAGAGVASTVVGALTYLIFHKP